MGQNDVRRERDQFRRVSADASVSAAAQRVSICTLRPSSSRFLKPAGMLNAGLNSGSSAARL